MKEDTNGENKEGNRVNSVEEGGEGKQTAMMSLLDLKKETSGTPAAKRSKYDSSIARDPGGLGDKEGSDCNLIYNTMLISTQANM
ncbi:hypothetical protein MAR_022529, partial [Mya arenaria]